MKILLDTHTFLWWNMDSPQLSVKAKEIISSGKSEVYLSAASTWEMAIKCLKGKLILPESVEKYVSSRMSFFGFLPLPIIISHTLQTYKLPSYHNDPFDRLLIAQCQLENMSLISTDINITKYDLDVIW